MNQPTKTYKAWKAYTDLGHEISFAEFKLQYNNLRKADVDLIKIHTHLHRKGCIKVGPSKLGYQQQTRPSGIGILMPGGAVRSII